MKLASPPLRKRGKGEKGVIDFLFLGPRGTCFLLDEKRGKLDLKKKKGGISFQRRQFHLREKGTLSLPLPQKSPTEEKRKTSLGKYDDNVLQETSGKFAARKNMKGERRHCAGEKPGYAGQKKDDGKGGILSSHRTRKARST